MKITSIEMYANDERLLNLELRNVSDQNSYKLKGHVGLDAEDLTTSFAGFNANGTKFFDVYMPPREVVFKIGLNPYTEVPTDVSELRDNLYRAISPSRSGQVEVRLCNGPEFIAYLQGSITKLETDHYAKEPSVDLTCEFKDPMLRSPTAIAYEPLVSISLVNPVSITDSVSTAPHGMKIQMRCIISGSLALTIEHPEMTNKNYWEFTLYSGDILGTPGFLAGDIIDIVSDFGQKSVTVRRGATVVPLSNHVDPLAIWPMMYPGVNDFYFRQNNVFDLTFIEYTPQFWGV